MKKFFITWYACVNIYWKHSLGARIKLKASFVKKNFFLKKRAIQKKKKISIFSEGQDSNPRSNLQKIYSLPPLTTWIPSVVFGGGGTWTHTFKTLVPKTSLSTKISAHPPKKNQGSGTWTRSIRSQSEYVTNYTIPKLQKFYLFLLDATGFEPVIYTCKV